MSFKLESLATDSCFYRLLKNMSTFSKLVPRFDVL